MKAGRDMLKEEFIQSNPEWAAELETMVQTKTKAEIQALSAFGFQCVPPRAQLKPHLTILPDWNILSCSDPQLPTAKHRILLIRIS